jgi:hypothetical protein
VATKGQIYIIEVSEEIFVETLYLLEHGSPKQDSRAATSQHRELLIELAYIKIPVAQPIGTSGEK